MNTNPEAKVVLCFGDSNTRGSTPDGNRYPADVRWTGQLQNKLGSDYYVIEEGLGGRTTNLEHPATEKSMRNGFSYFSACLESHSPVDVVIIMLGTNDHKNVYHRSTEETAAVLADFCSFSRSVNPNIKIILVAPASLRVAEPVVYYDAEAVQKSKDLAEEIEKVAKDRDTSFYNADESAEAGEDGIHWTKESHGHFAVAMAEKVRQLV